MLLLQEATILAIYNLFDPTGQFNPGQYWGSVFAIADAIGLVNIFPGLESCVDMNWPEPIREECESRWLPTRDGVVNNKVDFI